MNGPVLYYWFSLAHRADSIKMTLNESAWDCSTLEAIVYHFSNPWYTCSLCPLLIIRRYSLRLKKKRNDEIVKGRSILK